MCSAEAEPLRLSLPRIDTRNTHGTGCTFAAALTAYLVRGETIESAVHAAKAFVHKALQSGAHLAVGRGSGPVDILCTVRAHKEE